MSRRIKYTVPQTLLHPQPDAELLGRTNHTKGGRRNARFPTLNISKLAAKIGVHPTYLGRILSGKIQPRLRYAIKLSKALNISVEEIERLYVNNNSSSERVERVTE